MLELKHIEAFIWRELKTDPHTLLKEVDGKVNYDDYIRAWHSVEWLLKQEGKLKLQ